MAVATPAAGTWIPTPSRPTWAPRGVLLAVPTETRQSDHVGDDSRKVYPSTPEVGEEIPLGQGTLFREDCSWGSDAIGVQPTDGRTQDWMDIKALYRVHEQTVDLFFIPGGEMEPYEVGASNEEGSVTTGSDGTGAYFQVKSKSRSEEGRIVPQVKPLGGGMFVIGGDYKFVPEGDQ